MKHFFCYLLPLIFVFIFSEYSTATHNRAGEITYVQTGPLTIEMTIVTYTKASSIAADRDSLEVFWGDGSFEQVRRDNSRTRFDVNDIKINYYVASHTYPGVATYTISFLDPNRVGGILNVNFPNSIDIPFFLSTTFTLLDPQFQGVNNSVILLQPPIDIGCVDRIFTHNPNAYDADGDSLVFELVAPLQDVNTPVPNYRLPDQIGQFGDNKITINRFTGEIIWRTPKIQGDYNIAIKVTEYRNGRKINELLRDMQILIRACENNPPIIKAEDEYCIIAGTTLNIPIFIDDIDAQQLVRVSATGGPFIVPSPATFLSSENFRSVPFSTNIIWNTECSHISDQYYQIVVRAVDNFFPDSTGLATLKTIRIKVVGPAPTQLTSITENDGIKLAWDAPYFCDNMDNDNFRGFSVWRKISSTNFEPDTCNPGLSNSPYTRIQNISKIREGEFYTFFDSNIESSNTYCYRVQGEFAKLTSSNNPFNRVEGLPSNESCIIKNRDLPLMTKVSVTSTDANQGEIDIRWTKPLFAQYDTLLNKPPYTITLQRATEMSNFEAVWSKMSSSLATEQDTFYSDKNIDTRNNQYTYKISIISQNNYDAVSPEASSIFLEIIPTDKKNILQWQSQVPWNNYIFSIFREDDQGNFNKIGETKNNFFEDDNLINGLEYCYFIEAEGTYSIDNIENPLFNSSQIQCQIPMDNVPPCAPVISAANVCDRLKSDISIDDLYNTISWSNLNELCPDISEDLSFFNVYYSSGLNAPYVIVKNILKNQEFKVNHTPPSGLSGCYYVTSIDINGNESLPSDTVCLKNCPFYVLPNTFTPNNDGSNDLFKPLVNIFITAIDLKIYNQWGNLVHETQNPEINWDGKNQNGSELPDGTYYYKCQIFEQSIEGIIPTENVLSGHINIFRN